MGHDDIGTMKRQWPAIIKVTNEASIFALIEFKTSGKTSNEQFVWSCAVSR